MARLIRSANLAREQKEKSDEYHKGQRNLRKAMEKEKKQRLDYAREMREQVGEGDRNVEK